MAHASQHVLHHIRSLREGLLLMLHPSLHDGKYPIVPVPQGADGSAALATHGAFHGCPLPGLIM